MSDEKQWLPTSNNIDDYKLLIDMLSSQRKEFDILSKKKADGQLNLTKIKMLNRVLDPLKQLCEREPSHMFLDSISEDDIPTYSDVVLIISQYKTALDEFKKKYFLKDEYQSTYGNSVHRWMTQEYPPDYYNEEDEYEEDE